MPPKKKQNYRKDERGASLVIALIALMVVSLLGAGLVTVTSTETKTTANYSQLMQARYAAEAGVQRTINWLSNNYTPPTSYTAYTMCEQKTTMFARTKSPFGINRINRSA